MNEHRYVMYEEKIEKFKGHDHYKKREIHLYKRKFSKKKNLMHEKSLCKKSNHELQHLLEC